MKKLNISFIKDTIIALLIVLAIIIILAVIFYDKLAINKMISSPAEYSIKQEWLDEIKQEQEEQKDDIVVQYSINNPELRSYEGNEKYEYNKDKTDPFERYEYTGTEESNNTAGNTTTSKQTKNETKEPASIK